MTGRGIDQALPHPRDRRLFEPAVTSAAAYMTFAEETNGPIPAPVDYDYIWGRALAHFRDPAVDMRIVNLETSITNGRDFWPKGINYAMSPQNVACLNAARIDCCTLANNHVLDFGYDGLTETLDALRGAGIAVAGAGRDLGAAQAPAVKEVGAGQRVVVFAFGSATSGIPSQWAAGDRKAGIDFLPDLSARTLEAIARRIGAARRRGDVVVASIHWGENWGYAIPAEERAFAHGMIDAGVDVVHGHSSHHPKAVEVHNGKLILYGCGDFIDDYEGISGYEEFRDDLALMYLATLDGSASRLERLVLLPFQIKRFRLDAASHADVEWLRDTLNAESKAYGAQFSIFALERREGLELVLDGR